MENKSKHSKEWLARQINQLNDSIREDGVNFTDMEYMCETLFRMAVNPVPLIRDYFKRNDIKILVHYMEGETEEMEDDVSAWILRRSRKKRPIYLAVVVYKHQGYVDKVSLRVNSGLIDNDPNWAGIKFI